MEYVTIDVPVRLWHLVDGAVDNSMALDVVDAIMPSVLAGACVRDAGWRAAAESPGPRDQYGWPPPDHPLRIVLRREHWEWVLEQLSRWHSAGDAEAAGAVTELIEAGLRVP